MPGPLNGPTASYALTALLKVNLTLHVGGVRPDGYHPIGSVCLFAAAGDRVSLGERQADFALAVTGPERGALAAVPPDANLAIRAARLLAERTGAASRLIRLDKRVPAAGGVAGGTADAACVLVLLNAEAPRPLGTGELIALSRRLGADGPVCTAAQVAGGGVWLAEGDGDRVRRLPGPPPLWLTAVNPRVPVSTADVFARFDEGPPGTLDQPAGDTQTARGLAALGAAGRNDLHEAALHLAPVIQAAEAALRASPGCRFARMSGSGATVFGLFGSEAAARRAARAARARGWWSATAPLARG